MAKEFLGRSTQRILDEIARSFGPDALIVSSADRVASAAGTRDGRLLGVTARRADEADPASAAPSRAAGSAPATPDPVGWFGELTLAAPKSQRPTTSLRGAIATLGRRGFPEALARALVVEALSRLSAADLADDAAVREAIVAAAAARCPAPATLAPSSDGVVVAAFVGPSGCGKTRVVQRLAAQAAGFASRVQVGAFGTGAAGLERLGALAAVLGIAVSELRTAREARSLRRGSGVALIDTAGVGAGDASGIERLTQFLTEARVDETHVVVPAAIDPEEARDLLAALSGAPSPRLLVTKLDETRAPGRAAGLVLGSGVPVSYVSTGRDAVDDLTPAGPAAIAALVRDALRPIEAPRGALPGVVS